MEWRNRMQTDLRLLILIVGLVYAVYTLFNTYTRRQKKTQDKERHSSEKSLEQRQEVKVQKRKQTDTIDENDPLLVQKPSLKNDIPHHNEDRVDQKEPTMPSYEPKIRPEPISSRQIIAFSIVAKQNGISGRLLLTTLRANHFHFDNKIFHSYANNNPAEAIECSIACLVEPGTFDWQQITSKTYPGLMIWIQLTGKDQDAILFEKLLSHAKQIASTLNATLCDETRHPLSVQMIAAYRARIKENYSASMYAEDEVV